ncbi:hypothetical protein RV11_GL002033 [Enterococcus phoeniculicola]|nr:hypothetical protein RV11_GL002033 [Enterococcus phoeniculicola]
MEEIFVLEKKIRFFFNFYKIFFSIKKRERSKLQSAETAGSL